MRNKPTPESSHGIRQALTVPAVIAAVFLGLHILPLFWRPNPFWGADFLLYMPVPVQGLFILLAVLLFIPWFRRQIRTWAGAVPLALWNGGRRVWVSRTVVLLVALVGFVAFSSARHFLGDGYHLLEKLEAETWHDMFRAPLTYALVETLHRVGSTLWKTAENTYRVYSYASGSLYVLLSFPVAAALGKDALERSILMVFLLTGGYIQQFFGYVENYALYMPGLLLYFFLGLRTLEHRIPLFVPALLLGMLVVFHRVLGIFGPSLLYLAYHDYRRRQHSTPTGKNILSTAAALCCVPLSAAVFLGLSGVGFEAYFGRTGSGEFLPLLEQPGFYAQYRIFSFAHLVDFINLQLLSAPAACMVIFLVRKSLLGRQTFLAVCTVVPLFFTFIAKANIGAFRDWDILSLPALPFTVWAAAAFVERIRDRKQLFHGAFLICGAAALHTLLWIGVNASAEPAEARFTNQLGRLTGHASATGWVTMANFHRQQNNPSAALDAYKRALDADPSNPNRWLLVGNIHREMGKSATAIKYYNKAVELQPDVPVPYMNLGAAYSDIGQLDKAIRYTVKAISLQPELETAHMNLVAFYRKTGQLEKAIEHLKKAAVLRPKDATTHEHLAEMYRDAGQNEKATRHLEKAIALRPGHTRTLVNLAVACSDAGQNDRAIELLKVAVALQPEFAAVYVNLGAVYSKIGQYDTGIQYLSKAIELQPDDPFAYQSLGLISRVQGRYPLAIKYLKKALELQKGRGRLQTYLNIGNTYHDMGEREKAISYFQKAIQLDPNHANAHLLLGMTYRALNRGEAARVQFKKVLKLEPNHPQAAQIKHWLERLRK